MSARLHAREATGFTVAESREIFALKKSVVSWSPVERAVYGAERYSVVVAYFQTSQGCSNEAPIKYLRRK